MSGIRPDSWIRRMALEHGMIEPFEDRQVREGVISYGLSSYGYDLRVSDEFKVFTNVYAAIVDPKEFDPRSFVDVQGDICIVPPNSFALARSVEYFRIPRNVLTICVGKSTYARCFSGDTKVALLDGSAPTLEEMAARHATGEMFWGYAVGRYGRIEAALLDAPRLVGRDPLVEVALDDGGRIRCTPDHRFLLRDGRVVPAVDLEPDTSLMPLYRDTPRGYEMVWQPLAGHYVPTHRLADEWNVRQGIYTDAPGTYRHHLDGDRRNNDPRNLVRMDATDHVRLHNAKTYGPEFDPEAHSEAIRRGLAERSADPAWRERFRAAQGRRARRFWTDEAYSHARDRLRAAQVLAWSESRRREASERLTRRFEDPDERHRQGQRTRAGWVRADDARRDRRREIARELRVRDEITETAVWMALVEAGSVRGAACRLGVDRSTFRRFPHALARFHRLPRRNHRVASIRSLPGEHDVFCLTVPEAGNFALASGVFVENCGIIVNVTPFEPEWEGHVTLEISNTTPLPARIYAREGLAQVLFFESDEPCEVSYKERGGKYQSQRGVTLPRL